MLYRCCDLCGRLVELHELCEASVADEDGGEGEEHLLLCPACFLDLR